MSQTALKTKGCTLSREKAAIDQWYDSVEDPTPEVTLLRRKYKPKTQVKLSLSLGSFHTQMSRQFTVPTVYDFETKNLRTFIFGLPEYCVLGKTSSKRERLLPVSVMLSVDTVSGSTSGSKKSKKNHSKNKNNVKYKRGFSPQTSRSKFNERRR